MAEPPKSGQYTQSRMFDADDPQVKREDARMARQTVPVANFPVEDKTPRRTPSVVGCSHDFKVTLSPHTTAVNTGTPVGVVGGQWGVARLPEDVKGFAAKYTQPGEDCMCYRGVTLETYYDQFELGKQYSVVDIDDEGRIRFKEDYNGPHTPLSKSRILMERSF
jgi:hypothetical protein